METTIWVLGFRIVVEVSRGLGFQVLGLRIKGLRFKG